MLLLCGLLVMIVVGALVALGSYALNGELDQFLPDLKEGFNFSHHNKEQDNDQGC